MATLDKKTKYIFTLNQDELNALCTLFEKGVTAKTLYKLNLWNMYAIVQSSDVTIQDVKFSSCAEVKDEV